MTKVSKSVKNVTSFGGVFFAKKFINSSKIPQLIDALLGKRAKQAKYSFSDVLLNWAYCNLCGAKRLEDVHSLKQDFDLPSSDTIALIFKSWATENRETPGRSRSYEFNTNEKLNGLLIDMALKMGMEPTGVLDYDNVVIYTKKYDSTMTYKNEKGYHPGVAFLNEDTPIYIEGREGSMNPSHDMENTLKRCLEMCKSKGVKITHFRSDAAAYQDKVINLMKEEGIEYYIRAAKTTPIMQELPYLQWTDIKINGVKQRISEMTMEFKNTGTQRVVITHLNESYRAIITNSKLPMEDVVKYYNRRGKVERNFDVLKNDFNWGRLPFSFLNENTVFMYIGAICYLIYKWLLGRVAKRWAEVQDTFRLKKFISAFVRIPAIITGNDIEIFSQRPYVVLLR